MTMRLLGWGMVVTLLDLRLNGFDLLPDVAGWALITHALSSLVHHGAPFARARLAAAVGTLASALSLALFFSEQPLEVLRMLAQLVEALGWWGLCWWVLEGFVALARTTDPGAASRAQQLGRVLLVLNGIAVLGALVGLVAALAGYSSHGELPGVLAPVVVVGALVMALATLSLVLFCFQHADRDWLPEAARRA